MKLKIFTFVTGLLIALCAQAQTSGQTGPLTWSYDAGTKTLSITGTGDMPDYSNASPQPWKAYRSEIQTVTIGEGVTKIGVEAFINCSKLQSITIPSSVTTIGNVAFVACQNLLSITIPANVNVIGENTFVGSGLTAIHVDQNNATFTAEDGVLYNKSKTALICYPAGKTTPTFTISASVSTIGSYAFDGCTNLKEITVMWDTPLPVVPSIFSGVPLSAATLKVPAGKVADYQAAPVWQNFGTITDGTAVTGTAGPLTWSYDAGTKTLSITGTGAIPDYNALIVSPWRVYGNEIQTVTIGNGVTKIGQDAFGGLRVMQSITIPASVTEIGGASFAGCAALQSITIPSSVTTIGERAFAYCEALQSITIPAGVTTIGYGVFNICPALTAINVDPANAHYETENGVLYNKGKTELIRYPEGKQGTVFTVPDGVTKIGDGAFYVCQALQNIILPTGLTAIDNSAFSYCNTLHSITIPAKVNTIGGDCFNCWALTAINVDPANTHYESENGVLYNKGKTELIRYPQGKAGTAFTVPDGVTTIVSGAFKNCTILQTITLPTGLTAIGHSAFVSCTALQKITIPAGVTAIGWYAFGHCENLKEVTVQWNNPLSVDPDIFANSPIRTATLKVPAGKKALYQAAPVWKDFGTITESSVTPGTAELTVTPETARMMQVADDLHLSIQSNTDWTATSSEEWLTLSPSSGTKNGTVKATTTTNNDSQDRTATVTVKAGNQTRTVTVTQKGRKAPSSVDLNISEVQLMVGAQIQLSDTVRPWNEDVDREVIWSSSNTRVATVDDTGLVRAVGEGEAVITVQTEIGGFKATCNVTVSKQDAIVIPPPPASPVPDTDKKNVVTLSLTVPTDQGFTLSFVLNLPKGLVLDQEKTKLAESLIEQYTLTITPEGNGWKFEIKPNMLRKAADQFVVREMVHVAYTADPSVEKGNYDAQIKKLHLTFTDGSTLAKNEIPFKITVHTTTSNELIEANRQVWTAGGRLYVTSPVRETVEVYTFGGKLVFRTVKPVGEAVYDLVMPEGAAIVRGSSGWTKKVKK